MFLLFFLQGGLEIENTVDTTEPCTCDQLPPEELEKILRQMGKEVRTVKAKEILDFAESLRKDGKCREAAVEYLRFTTLFPSSDSADYAHFMVGYCYKMAGMYESAERVFKAHINEGRRGQVWAHYELAKLYLYLGDTVSFYSELSQMPRKSLQRKALIAWMRLSSGDWNGAFKMVVGTPLQSYLTPPKLRSSTKAALLSLIPGLGHLYLGDRGTAYMGMLFVGSFYALAAYYGLKEHRPIPALASLGAGLAFHIGQIYGSWAMARVMNRAEWKQVLEEFSRGVEKVVNPKLEDFL
ncbi:MAG: hypothetical protein GXO39_00980 [Thermotogae bacterium]|nr:hypothetical protein [Thermotogota bacterium]